jgi:hypothetical protein
MKAVMIATDFLKDNDGSFKILELNTNVGNVTTNINNYFDIEAFNEFIVSNEIDVIEFINQSMVQQDMVRDMEEVVEGNLTGSLTLEASIRQYYTGSSVSVTIHNLQATSATIPYIEDAPNKLILRNAYDSTALIDDTYAKDNFEFLKLMYDTDTNSIPKTYFVDSTLGIDGIGDDIRDNGEYPNFIVKERYPTTNYQQYPKIYKISTAEELSDLKNSLPSNTLLQEYIINTNDLSNNKLQTYRSVDIIYGSDLEVMNLLTPYVHTNSTILASTADFDENNELQYWERPIYLQKVNNNSNTTTIRNYKVDTDSQILAGDGSFKNINDIVVGDSLKSIQLNNLGTDDNDARFYSSSVADVLVGSPIINTNVTNVESFGETTFWLKEITLNDGTIFSDVDSSTVIAKLASYPDSMFRFTQFRGLDVNDEVIVVNTTTNELEIKTISSIDYIYTKEIIYKLEVEESDLYLTMEEQSTSPVYALVQHNPAGLGCSGNCCDGGWYCYAPCNGYSYSGYSGYYNPTVCCQPGNFYCYGWSGNWCEQGICGGINKT